MGQLQEDSRPARAQQRRVDAQLLASGMADEHVEQLQGVGAEHREAGLGEGFDALHGDGHEAWIAQILRQAQGLSDRIFLGQRPSQVHQRIEGQGQNLGPGFVLHPLLVPEVRLHGLHELAEHAFGAAPLEVVGDDDLGCVFPRGYDHLRSK